MSLQKNICHLLNIKYPIIQAGMVWVSGAKLAAASANAGILGIIGAGSMKPDVLAEHIDKANKLLDENCSGNLAVNVPLLYKDAEKQIQTAIDKGIRIFFTSAGSPKKFTPLLKENSCVVVHVTSSPELAFKCEAAGVDAIVAEGFEAGGHNGRDEITTMCLIPQVTKAVSIPVIAAGGIATGASIAAAFALGASAVQMGTRFIATQESSAHDNFKNAVVEATSDSTMLAMRELVPVRLLKNNFYEKIAQAQLQGATKEKLQEILGKGRAKQGMLEGDIKDGELEAGQISGLIHDLPSVEHLVQALLKEYQLTIEKLPSLSFLR